MLRFLAKVLIASGKRTTKRKDTYESNYTGQWKNKGDDSNERWEWVEKTDNSRPFYVNIFNLEDDYILTVGYHPKKNAVDSMECRDKREVTIALDLFEARYSALGNVIRDMEAQE
jgi:hypothetical protein